MERLSSILLSVDVTARGFDAEEGPPLEVLSAIAETNWVAEVSGAKVTVMATVEQDSDPELVDFARFRLEKIVVPRLEAQGDIDVVAVVGDPQQTVVKQVLKAGHDLVVVGARKSSLVHRTLVGSTSLALLRTCPCAVLVAPRRSETGSRVVLSAVAMKHDLTPRVLEISAKIVKRRGGRWHVFHCPEYPLEGGMRLRGVDVQEVEEYEAEVRKEAWADLHAVCDPLEKEIGVKPKLWMSEGLPSEQIGLAVRELGADILVMGTRGRRGLAGVLVGNTAEKVFHTTECALLAIKPEGFESPVSAD